MADNFRRIPYKATKVSDPKADKYNKGFTLRKGEWPLAGAAAESDKMVPNPIYRGKARHPGSQKYLPEEDYKNIWWEDRPPINKSESPDETGRKEDI